MEGVGARLGRSSARYGPTTVFTGPVRRWKKKWIHVTPSSSGNNRQTTAAANGSNGSHLVLFKWAPITASQNINGPSNGNGNDERNGSVKDEDVAVGEPRKRKFKYIPIALLEEQKYEESEQTDNEAKPNETETNSGGPTSETDGFDEKPDINDMPMDESQAPQNNPTERQDLNESTLDLSLG